MKNVWSDHHLKAAEYAEKAAVHYKRAAEYYNTGNPEKAIHHALLAITQIDYSTEHAQQAKEYCLKTMIDDMLES